MTSVDVPGEAGQALTLVSAIDRNYVVPYSVMLASLRETNPRLTVAAYVLHYDLSDDDLAYLERLAAANRVSLCAIRIPLHPFVLFKTRRRASLASRRTMSPIAYAKAFTDSFLPTEVERALLIDADTVITGDMTELAVRPLARPIAAVANIPRNHHHQFNSGVALIDLRRWRKLGVSAIAERFLFEYSDSLHSHDQQTLNLIFGENWERLALKWNYIEDHYRFIDRNTAFSREEILAAREAPVVVHYAVSADKPWRADSTHPRADIYRAYGERLKPQRIGLDVIEPS